MLDVRHGPMVLIGKDTLVVVALGSKCELEVNLIKDLVSKGATVVTFSDIPFNCGETKNISFDDDLSHITKGIAFIILNQMLAYYKSKETGADPDKPTGLDPWIAL